MGNIKFRDKNGNWIAVGSTNATGIATANPKLTENGEKVTVDTVLEDHEDRVSKLERNVSWLAKHGGGGSGGGGGSSISEATCTILVNGMENNSTVILDESGLIIELKDISVKATKTWRIIVRVGSVQVATLSASYVSPIATIPFNIISAALNNHKGNINVLASYEDDMNGVYGSVSWTGAIVESVVRLTAPNVSVGLNEDGTLEKDESVIYTYSVGIVGEYTLKLNVISNKQIVNTLQYSITTIDTTENTFAIRVVDLLPKLDFGVYSVEAQLFFNENVQVQNSIKSSITIISKTILISTVTMSEDQNNPILVNLSGSINLTWTAYLQGSSTFQYNYKIGNTVIKENTVGYFEEEINDFISVIGKEWAVEDTIAPITINITVGDQSTSKVFYFKFIKSSNDFLPYSRSVIGHRLANFLSREYNNGTNSFNLTNTEYLIGGKKTTASAKLKMFDVSNIVGIKTSTAAAPYLRISNGAYAKLMDFSTGGVSKSFANIVAAANNDFTISISFKADYHPDDDRTILCCGQIDSNTGKLITGFEINVHDIYVNTSSLLRLTDNVVNNIDIVCIHTDDDYIDSDGKVQKERHYIVKIYLEGALSKVNNYVIFPTLGSEIFIGGKVFGANNTADWLCDCNIYNLQVYDYALSDLDIVTNYINNKVSSSYKNGEFDFSLINTELRNNFCERAEDGSVLSHIYKNGAYTLDFLLDGNKLSETKLNDYAGDIGIPIMLIDVSNDDSWTFENFVNQQTADNVQLNPTSGKTITYWDPTQSNQAIVKINNTSIELQGTSTLQDAVKNINITVPNDTVFIPKDTWLPEQTYTLKADVVDSSHSNNAAIGKFINTVLKDYFPADPIALDNVENSNYVKTQQPTATLKHTVEGFPILLIMNFHTTETSKVSATPLGIYSFNLGRDAFRNLGFRKVNQIIDSTTREKIEIKGFPFALDNCIFDEVDSNANWVEIKDTSSIPDMAKLTGASLPADFNSSTGDFWQNDPSILNLKYEVRYPAGRQPSDYTTFVNFVSTIMSLPIEGLYRTKDRIGNVERPEITTEYDLYRYQDEYIKTGKKQQIITDVNQLAALGFNAVSMYKYFVIASFFGLIDNFGKNSTYRSWEGGDYTIGFYDLDSALGGGNQGTLSIEPNMWLKYLKNEIIEGKPYGFVAETFNFEDPLRLSNTVASANHNKLWLSMDTNLMRNKLGINEVAGTSAYSYYWDDFRTVLYNIANKAGYQDIAEYFVNEFYLKQTGQCGPLLFNLDYKLKYLVQFTNDKYSNTKHLSKLHGRKAAYTLDWLKKHILFLDSIFYWRNTTQKFAYPNDVNCKMSSTVYNTPEAIPITSNTDLILYHNVGDVTKTYYYIPKNTKIFIDAGANASNSEFTWGLTNSPQIIQIGDEETPLSKMNIYKLSHTNTDLRISNPGLTAFTELSLQNSNSLAAPFGLDSFQPEIGVSELRIIDFANTKSRLIQGTRPTFSIELVKQLAGGATDTKFTKLREIDISNSECVSDITIPSVPLKRLAVYNSALTNLNLDDQNYIEQLNLTGCTKLIKITIKECDIYKNFSISNLNNLQEINILNNKALESISVVNCPNLQKVTIQNNGVLKTIQITNCASLVGGSGTNYLTITDNNSLTTLNLSNCINLNTFTISKSNQAGISTLNLTNTSVTYISGDGANESLLDLKAFIYGSGISITGNTKVTEIQYANNLNKPITINTTFQNCINLKRIYGNLILTPSSGPNGSGMFRQCTNFTIHGDNNNKNALGVNTWNGKSTRNSNGVRSIYAILTDSDDNVMVNGTRPYDSVTWQQSFVSGDKVTNIRMGNNALDYMFYYTALTEFDVMYMLFVIGQTITSNFSIYRTFYPLTRTSGQQSLFNTTNNPRGMNLFTFYKFSKCTSISEGFHTGTTFIRSRDNSYDINGSDGSSNGVLSFLTNCTSLNSAFTGNIIVDNNVFKLKQGNLKFTNLSWLTISNVLPGTSDFSDNTNMITTAYNNYVNSNYTKLGDFTGMFDALPSLSSLYGIFKSLSYINYDTITLPKSIVSVNNSFMGTYAKGVIDIKRIFNGCTKLSTLTYVFVGSANSSYGDAPTFPISADMFNGFPNLTKVGYDPSDVNQNISTYSFAGARHYIVDDTFPENIIVNNPNITVFSHIFYGCEDKSFANTPKLPGNIFTKATKLTNTNSLFANAEFTYTLSSNGFANCPNINNVGRMFAGNYTSDKTKRGKLIGEIPAKLFYHGATTTTIKVYGTNQETKPDSTFDLETLQEHTITITVPRNNISNIQECFSGQLNIPYYTNKDNIDMIENNPDYSPFKWNYNKDSKTWYENGETKVKIAYWGYTGVPSSQNNEHKYLEDGNIEIVSENGVPGKIEVFNYMCAPDLLRYCTINTNLTGLFANCGMDYTNYGIINSDENYQSYGINGRIPPYLLKPVYNITSVANIFKYCRKISSYKQDGIIYQIPKEFFSYTPKITELTSAFQGLDFISGTQLNVFDSLKESLDIRKIFCFCRYFTNAAGVAHDVSNVFVNNTIIKITGAFSENDVSLSGDYNGSERIYWTLNNGAAATFNNNFKAGKVPSSQNIKWVYYGWGNQVNDAVIPNGNNNY